MAPPGHPLPGLAPARQALLFARQFIANPRHVGAVLPSSRALVEGMLDAVDWSAVTTAVEFGPGTGVVTRRALARMRPDARLLAFEINPEFARYLASSIADPRLSVMTMSAEHVGQCLPDGCDVALSSLPFSIMPREVRGRILNATAAALRPGGLLVGYQYSPAWLAELRSVMPHVNIRFEIRNWPPAVIFAARP